MNAENNLSIRKEILVQLAFFFALFRSILVLSIRGVLCPSKWLTITGSCQWHNVSVELIFLAVLIILLVLEVVWDHGWKEFFLAFKMNWPVLVFIGLSGISIFWSIQSSITLYKFVVLLGSSIIAIYVGRMWDLEKFLKSLTWFITAICLSSLLFALFLPNYGTMLSPFYKGAWNGIFWHRNYLGCFMALGISLFLVNLLTLKKRNWKYFILNLMMLGLSSFLLIKSKSATGIISSLVLAGLIFVLYAWIKWGQNLKPIHYFSFLGVILVITAIIMMNLNFFFGLLGRNSSLTGRVPMWEYLFQNVINQHPWLGYGYGAIWHLVGFRDELAQIQNWGAPVLIGDNGFIDILLHLGIIGLSILVMLMTLGFIQAIKYLLKQRSLTAAFPVLLLTFGIVGNISLSLILETETLVWMIALTVLVSIRFHSPVVNLNLGNAST